MNPRGKKLEPKLGLDMPFAELVERLFDADKMRLEPMIVGRVTSHAILAGQIAKAFDVFEQWLFDENVFAIGEEVLQRFSLRAIGNANERGIETVHLRFFAVKSALQQTTHTQSAAHPCD